MEIVQLRRLENNIVNVTLIKHDVFGYGFAIGGGLDNHIPTIVSDILDGSPAGLCEELEVGDSIISVNDQSVIAMTTDDVLKTIHQKGPVIRLCVRKDPLVKLKAQQQYPVYKNYGPDSFSCEFQATSDSSSTNLLHYLAHQCAVTPPQFQIYFEVEECSCNECSPVSGSMDKLQEDIASFDASPACSKTRTRRSPPEVAPKQQDHRQGSHGTNGSSIGGTQATPLRFETFVMTGDMIIKTASVPAMSQPRRFEGHIVDSSVSTAKSTNDALINDCIEPTPPSPKLVEQNGQFDCTIADNGVGSSSYFSNEYDNSSFLSPQMEILGYPRFADVPIELDIPPDDISSEDEMYKSECDVDIDDLPPPPDDFLSDFAPPTEIAGEFSPQISSNSFLMEGTQSTQQSQSNNTWDNSVANVRTVSSNSQPVLSCPHLNDQLLPKDCYGLESRNNVMSSHSAEKIATNSEKNQNGQTNSDRLIVVRGSKSHENYLQFDDGIGFVAINLEDGVAASIDALHYEKSGSSLESLEVTSSSQDRAVHSLENLPKNDKIESLESVLIPSFISIDKSAPFEMIKPQEVSKVFKQSSLPSSPEHPIHERPSQNLVSNDMETKCILQLGGTETSDSQDDSNLDITISADQDTDLQLCDDETGQVSEALNGILFDEDAWRPPLKDVDRPSAQRLAKRLFNLDGFQRSDVAKHLGKKNDFAYLVGEEYLCHFDFTSQTLDGALRNFLRALILSGETQERERILAHFSHRFVECNPVSYVSEDACHTLTCAMMLLNTDLHKQNIGRKMTVSEFIENLADLNDSGNFPKDLLKNIYQSISNEPIECDVYEDTELSTVGGETDPSCVHSVNPFLDVPDPSKAREFKKGFVMRKCCVDPDGHRTSIGKRGWKMFYATLRDMVLYLHKDDHAFKRQTVYDSASNVLHVHHALAVKAVDYNKKQHVFRLRTSDMAQYLFQTSDSQECQSWIETINLAAASLSSSPLPGAVGSQKKFQRPLMPSSYTKLGLKDQLAQHERTLEQIERDLIEHRKCAPEKGSKNRVIQDFLEKETYLSYEQNRFKTYCLLLQSKLYTMSTDQPEKSLLEVTIGEVDEPSTSPVGSFKSKDARKQQLSAVQRSQSDRYSYKAAIQSGGQQHVADV